MNVAVKEPVKDKATTPTVPGVKLLEAKQARLQRRLVLVVTVVPFIGFLAAVWTLWGTGLSMADASIFLAAYCFTGLGVTIGFHRLFTHKSFEAKPWFRNLLAIAGSMAIQGPVIRWVADHRRHHAFADQPGDPHSPHLDEGPGVKGVAKGLWHAHIGWFFDDEQTSARRWAPTSAVHGIGKGQVDLSAGAIRLLQKVGIARDVKVATEKQLDRKQAQS